MKNKKLIRKLLKTIIITLAVIHPIFSQITDPQLIAGIAGYWKFDDSTNLTLATIGNDLILNGIDSAVAGYQSGDGATNIGIGNYYTLLHGIASNGGGSFVNEYSMLYDFKINSVGTWRCFFQTDTLNSNDGECFISPAGLVGVAATGYTSVAVVANQWYRLVISVKNGTHYDYYLNGQLVTQGTAATIDNRFALRSKVLLFADENAEDDEITVSNFAIFDHDITATEIAELGGFELIPGTIKPYLQTPSAHSIYISWHSLQTASTIVRYGTTTALGDSTVGSFQYISGKVWHTVQLLNLIADTTYYYFCISGNDTSSLYSFNTQPATNHGHLRFAIVGDSQTNILTSEMVVQGIKDKCIEQYGNEWYKELNLITHVGDIVTLGSNIALYESEFFNPFSTVSAYVPIMAAIGNHEVDNQNYYDYMKYEDLSDYQYPNTYCEHFYSMILGDVQFIFLNSNAAYSNNDQLNWLDQKLLASEMNPNIDFVFVFNHHPRLSEIWPDGNTEFTDTGIVRLLQYYPKVAQISNGHSHCYEHGVVESKAVNSTGDFNTIITGGCGGTLDRWEMFDNQTDYNEIYTSLDYYNFVFVDVDMDNRSFEAACYAFGNPDKPLDCILVDNWHRNLNLSEPNQPFAFYPSANESNEIIFTASPFSGADTLMTSQFQISDTSGNFLQPLLDTMRNFVNYYGDSGSPVYAPINLNAGIDLTKLEIQAEFFDSSKTYYLRVRYRDKNLRWSNWSEERPFVVNDLGFSSETYHQFAVSVSPNPANSIINFSIKNIPEGNHELKMKIFNAFGIEIINTEIINQCSDKVSYSLNTDTFHSGIYWIAFFFNDKYIAKKSFEIIH